MKRPPPSARMQAKHFGLMDGTTGKAEDDQQVSGMACYKCPFNRP